jgi:hydrogenase maturation protease
MKTVVIGVGNDYRRDDGIGPAVAERIRRLDLPDVQVVTTDGEPTRVLDAWTGADLAVVIDAAVVADPIPGRSHRLTMVPDGGPANSSHGLGVPEAVELAKALDRMPRRLVFYTVEITETGFGTGLSDSVSAAIPSITTAVLREMR